MPFSKEGAKLKTAQSKNCINDTRVTMLFSKKRGKTENTSLKNSVNGTQSTMLFSQERGRLKITPSKIELSVHRVQGYFAKKEHNRKSFSQTLH